MEGVYSLLPDNVIAQTVETPVQCHGFSLFLSGELIYFKSQGQPQKHHSLQVWRTSFVQDADLLNAGTDHFLSKVGNLEVVRALSACQEILTLINKGESYESLYADIVRQTRDTTDSYFWFDSEEVGDLKSTQRLNEFVECFTEFVRVTVPAYLTYESRKQEILEERAQGLRLDSFKPRILSSFVRNQLLDQVYLPIIGDNFAKQIGVVGENTRTDRISLLLLVSPPGYGKTTLMEYVANSLGITFVKINGPAIGHEVTSLDPSDAPNASAREEVERLNLAFKMGDNAMIYLDDIQHCHPEFLQKFISLCDGQRKIEGVFGGKPCN